MSFLLSILSCSKIFKEDLSDDIIKEFGPLIKQIKFPFDLPIKKLTSGNFLGFECLMK